MGAMCGKLPGHHNEVIDEAAEAEVSLGFSPAKRNKPFIGDSANKYVYNDYTMGESKLGEGVSGPIRLVKSRKTGKMFALKTIYIPEDVSDAARANLLEEVEILQTLDHPNVVKLYDVYRSDTTIYLIMEYCSGPELMDHVSKMTDVGQVRSCAVGWMCGMFRCPRRCPLPHCFGSRHRYAYMYCRCTENLLPPAWCSKW